MAFSKGHNFSAKLTNEQVLEIRERYMAGGCTQASLCREYDVNRETIGRIVRGETRRTVPMPQQPLTESEKKEDANAILARVLQSTGGIAEVREGGLDYDAMVAKLNKKAEQLPVGAEARANHALNKLTSGDNS